jgi:hypothetical protein
MQQSVSPPTHIMECCCTVAVNQITAQPTRLVAITSVQ